MTRASSTAACVAIALLFHAYAAALQAQVSVNASDKPLVSLDTAAHATWIERYASTLGVGAAQTPGPLTTAQRLAAVARQRREVSATYAARPTRADMTECPMRVMKADSSRDTQMSLVTPDSASIAKWPVEGRIIGCVNPLQR